MVDVVTVYIVVAAIFAILLLIMALSGGLSGAMDIHVDIAHPDIPPDMGGVGHDMSTDSGQFSGATISPLSLPILFAFGAFFGAFGALLEITQTFPTIVVPFFAGGMAALLTGIIFWVLVKLFAESQGKTEYKMIDLVGMAGEITIPAAPGTRGQVLVITDARGRTLLSAVSSEAVGTGDRVKVTGIQGNALVVEKV